MIKLLFCALILASVLRNHAGAISQPGKQIAPQAVEQITRPGQGLCYRTYPGMSRGENCWFSL